MECILCLDFDSKSQHIRLRSVEGEMLDIQRIIEKHFWLLLDATAVPSSKAAICQSCWQSLFLFHEFYLRVAEIHEQYNSQATTDFSDTTNPLETLSPLETLNQPNTETIYIKEESTMEPEKLPTLKRRRGRPRKSPNATETPLFDIENDIAESIFLSNDIKEESLSGEAALHEEQAIQINTDEGNEGEVHKTSIIPKEEHSSQRQMRSSTSRKNIRKVHDEITDNATLSAEMEAPTEGSCDKPKKAMSKVLCSKTMVSKQHDEFIAANFKLNCSVCQQTLDNFSALKTHFRTEHGTCGYAMCCNKKLLKRGLLVDHINTHLNPDYFKCQQCDRVSADRNCLEIHMKTHDNKRERVHQCDICSKNFIHVSSYNRHVLTHVPNDQRKIACPECEKTFPSEDTMRQHLNLVHLNMYMKICDICGKSYRGREEFRRHLEEHAGVQRARIQCELCGGTYSNKYKMKRHVREVHTDKEKGPHICTICSKESHNLSAHKSHMKYVHIMERKHACPMCDKAFKRPRDLKEHMTTHTGEVLYTCPHCPKTFNSKANMHSHRKKMHRKEWEERRMRSHQQSHSILPINASI